MLTFLRKRPTRLTRVTQAFLRKQFSARAQRVARHTPRPDTKRLGVPALLKHINPLPSRSYLSAFRRTLFRRLLTAVPPQRRARKALYCAINNAAKFVRVVLPTARKRKRHARLGRELRSALFAFRRSRVRLRYSNLHSKYVARVGTNLRRRLVRRLRAKRLCVKTAVKFARTRRVRALAARITCLRRVNSRVKRAAQLLNGVNHQVPTPRNVKL